MNLNEKTTGTQNKACPVTDLLVSIGQTVLKGDHNKDWMDMETLAGFCKDNHILLHGHLPSADELESELRALFQKTEEIFAKGVNVIWADRRVGWDLLYSIRFYPYNPLHRKINIFTPEFQAELDSVTA